MSTTEQVGTVAMELHQAQQAKREARGELIGFLKQYERDMGRRFVYADAGPADKDAYDAIYKRLKKKRNALGRRKVKLANAIWRANKAAQA